MDLRRHCVHCMHCFPQTLLRYGRAGGQPHPGTHRHFGLGMLHVGLQIRPQLLQTRPAGHLLTDTNSGTMVGEHERWYHYIGRRHSWVV